MTLLRAAPVVALLALGGCGGSSSDSASTKTADGAAAKPAKTTPSAGSASKGKLSVAIKDFDYAPKQATVGKGAKVTWTNQDTANHTVTFDTGQKQSLGNQAKGARKSFTFAKAGSYAYHCDFHPNMHGTIVVR